MLMLRNQNLHLMAATTVKPGQRQILCCREKAALRITSSASVWAGNKSSVTFPLGYVAGNSIVTSVLAEEAVKSSKFTTLSNIRDVHTGRERSLGRRAAELGRGVSKHLWCRKTMFISAHELTQTLASWRCEPERSRMTSKWDVAVHDSRGEQDYRKELCLSRGKYFSVSGLLPASTRGACSRYAEWTLTRWVNTTPRRCRQNFRRSSLHSDKNLHKY